MNYKKSFTLSEIMIAMAIFGIIAAACIPIVLNMSPNKNAIMIKKAYYTTEQIVSDLINDPIYYPTGDFAVDSNVMAEETATNASPEKPTQFAKFSCLFAKKMNIDENNSPVKLENFCKRTVNNNGTYNNGADYILKTNDGMIWNFILCNGNQSFLLDSEGKPDDTSMCRIDVSVSTDDITKTGYDTEGCIEANTTGWGNNICGQSKVNKIGKAVFMMSHDGGISLYVNDRFGSQPNIQNIINGTTSLLGK